MFVSSVPVKLIAEALFINISITPNLETTYSIAFFTFSSSLISHYIGNAYPPAASISLAAEKIVPGNLG